MATVAKRGDSYKITISSGYDIHGKQVRHHRTWTPDEGMTDRQIEKELERQKVLFEEECKSGNAPDGKIKFEAFAHQWFKEYAEPKLKERTLNSYLQYSKRVYKAIGHLRMDKINTRTIQKFIINLGEIKVNVDTEKEKPLAPKTIKNYLSYISSIFDYAVTQGLIKTNPCKGVALPSIPSVERECYTLEEAQTFLELLEKEPFHWRVFYSLAIYGGFRRAELLGLEWKDIDFGTGVITIQRTSCYTKRKGVYTDTPKTKSSRRSLKMPDEMIVLLKKYKAAQAAEQLKLGDQWQQTDRLFVTWNGKSLTPGSERSWLLRFFERTGMRVVCTHSFRHLNASLLINSGTDVKTVSSALGHTQVSTTLNIYAHTFAAAQAKAADAIANTLTFTKENKHQIGIFTTRQMRKTA